MTIKKHYFELLFETALNLLKPVMQYIKCLVNKITLSDNLWFIEYNIGLQICNHFKLKLLTLNLIV